jgi:hypothetical protein
MEFSKIMDVDMLLKEDVKEQMKAVLPEKPSLCFMIPNLCCVSYLLAPETLGKINWGNVYEIF